MKRIALFLALLMFILPVTANAASTRNVSISPGLKIDGTTAVCSLLVVGNSENDEIEIVVKLYKGSNCIATWSESGTGYLNFLKNKTVSKGTEYTLTAEVEINGTMQPPVSITKKS